MIPGGSFQKGQNGSVNRKEGEETNGMGLIGKVELVSNGVSGAVMKALSSMHFPRFPRGIVTIEAVTMGTGGDSAGAIDT
jgi:hypothetical protein